MLQTLRSSDLIHGETLPARTFPEDVGIYNTSVCRGPDRYVMAIEIGGTNPVVGRPFTCAFAQSQNLIDGELLPTDRCEYDRSRYTACPTIRCGEFYDMIYPEGVSCHRWIPYIVRTVDFEHFEPGVKNPGMFFSGEDKKCPTPNHWIGNSLRPFAHSMNCNRSDADLCELEGKTVILYSWGNQLGREFLAQAEYDGKMEDFLASFFR